MSMSVKIMKKRRELSLKEKYQLIMEAQKLPSLNAKSNSPVIKCKLIGRCCQQVNLLRKGNHAKAGK